MNTASRASPADRAHQWPELRGAGFVPWSGLVVSTWALLHWLVWLVCMTSVRFDQFRGFWTSSGLFGVTVLQASAAATVGLGALVLLDMWGEVTQRREGRVQRLIAHAVSLLLVGSLLVYFRSVASVVERIGD